MTTPSLALQLGDYGSMLDYGGLAGTMIWLLLGLVFGMALLIAFAGNSNGVNQMLLKQILRGNKTGWAFVQRGNNYHLEPLDRDKDTNAYSLKPDSEEAEWLTDPADKMHTWHGIPVGLALEGNRPMVDIETAAAAERASTQATDGGEIQPTDTYTPEDLQDKLVVGSMAAQDRVIQYINPYVSLPENRVVDLRNITKLLRYDAGSDTPRKAAKNAVEAENALNSNLDDLKEFGKIITAFMLGAIATYIGVTGGGGGGGGSVGIMIATGLPI